jgi:uncharacterized Fe-S cluster-containing radical SAM superfamily protein
MVQKNVIICDICETSIANRKCSLCDRDGCENCLSEKSIAVSNDSAQAHTSIISFGICDKCEDKLEKISSQDPRYFENIFKDKEELLKEIMETFKTALLLYKIEEGDKPPQKEKNITYNIPIATFPSTGTFLKRYKPKHTSIGKTTGFFKKIH